MIISIPPCHQDGCGVFMLNEPRPTDCQKLNQTRELSSQMDISLIPSVLYSKLDMRIVNHDGGADILKKFCSAGALCQMNLTLCRQKSLLDCIQESEIISQKIKEDAISSFDERCKFFFPKVLSCEGEGFTCGIPAGFRPVVVLRDVCDEVAIVTFDCREGNNYRFL